MARLPLGPRPEAQLPADPAVDGMSDDGTAEALLAWTVLVFIAGTVVGDLVGWEWVLELL